MESTDYCNLCLATDVKLFCLSIPSICGAYLQLLQNPTEQVQGHACYECANLLRKYREFHSKCNNAQMLLSYLHPDHTKITKQMVQLIDRKLHKLESKLSQSKTFTDNDIETQPVTNDTDSKFFLNEIKIENFDENNEEITNNLTEAIVIEHSINSVIEKPPKKRKKVSVTRSKSTAKKKKQKLSIDDTSIKEENGFDDDRSLSDIDDVPLSEITKTNGTQINVLLEEPSTNTNLKNHTIERNKKGDVKKSPGWKFNIGFYKDYATVLTMTKEEAKKEMLLRKESSNYKNCAFKCELCFRGYDTKVTYENHMKKHNLNYGAFECEICHLRFSTKFIMWQHHTTCHKRKFLCKICSYTCFCTQQARAHINRHKGMQYTCKDCGEVFGMHNSMLMHQRIKHKAEVVCDICGSVFVVERGLKSHRRLLHTQEKNEEMGPKCEECSVKFSTEIAWKRHLVLSSKHKVSNGCEHCGDTFPDAASLRLHLKLHSRVYKHAAKDPRTPARLPGPCDIVQRSQTEVLYCELWLTTRSMHKAHMASQHPESVGPAGADDADKHCMCELCGKVFKKQCFLEYHKRTHTGERPFQCGECGRAYTTKGGLSTHRAGHAARAVGPRPPPAHACHLCDKVLQSRSALNKHVKVAHLGIRPHKCAICEKTFPNPCEVKYHMKHVHFKVPWPKRDRSKRQKDGVA